jgi:tRNA threonylcarbamoyladenosine biosynthesis protein TsaB
MKTLAIDTSLAPGSVAAADDDGVTERPLGAAGDHSRLLAAALEDVAGQRGWHVPDADLVVVVRGPGSFTGLRVGVATAKALAWATSARLVGVSGFAVVARMAARLASWHEAPIIIPFDAGRGEVFVAVATPAAEAGGWHVGSADLVPAAAWIAALPAGARVAGPALERLAPAVAARDGIAVAPAAAWFPTAGAAAVLGGLLAAAGVCDDAHTLLPDYLRPSYAEERAAGPGETGR